MNQRQLHATLACGMGAVLLTGCGAAKSVVNSNIPAIDDPLHLNGASIVAPVTGNRAPISGSISVTVTFPDRAKFAQQGELTFVKLEQAFEDTAQVAVPPGVALPGSFSLSNITLGLSVSDGNGSRTAGVQGNYSGPVTYTRTGQTDQYVASKPVGYSELKLDGDGFRAFRDILTSEPTPNTATAHLSFDTDDTALPKGSVITLKLKNGKARIGI